MGVGVDATIYHSLPHLIIGKHVTCSTTMYTHRSIFKLVYCLTVINYILVKSFCGDDTCHVVTVLGSSRISQPQDCVLSEVLRLDRFYRSVNHDTNTCTCTLIPMIIALYHIDYLLRRITMDVWQDMGLHTEHK